MKVLKLSEVKLKYPQMREELIDYLEELSDVGYQKDVWVNHLPREGVVYSEMSYAIHFIFDDTCLAKDPGAAVGVFLKNEKEVEVVRDLVAGLENVFNLYGTHLSDADYMETSEWLQVVDRARIAKSIIR